jgi:hypothetical protein
MNLTDYPWPMRDESECVTRGGRQLAAGQMVSILSPVNGHSGYGRLRELLPGTIQDVPCVMVSDASGRLIVVNAVNVTVDEPAADECSDEQCPVWH